MTDLWTCPDCGRGRPASSRPATSCNAFRLTSAAEVDAEFRGWLAAAYQVGAQQHLRRG